MMVIWNIWGVEHDDLELRFDLTGSYKIFEIYLTRK